MMTSSSARRQRKWLVSGLAITTLLLTACGRPTSAEPTPPTVYYGQDVCELCGMIVSESAYAAAYVTDDGHGHIFDDIGDMVRGHLKMREEVTAFFVHDYEGERWIRAETAHFILIDSLATPMGSRLIACETLKRAEALAGQLSGQVMTFENVLAHYENETLSPMLLPEKDSSQSWDHH